jgi:septum formation protein
VRLILASASPRRRELLSLTGLPFEVIPSRVEEPTCDEHPQPGRLAVELARSKAWDVLDRTREDDPAGILCVVGADTVVAIGARVYGKPRDAADARRILGELSGRTHQVITGVAVLWSQPGLPAEETAFPVSTEVTFRTLDAREIQAYIATGEPLDKAGAYAVQGIGALLIQEVWGDYPNVVGLPISRLAAVLRRHAIPILGVGEAATVGAGGEA